LSLSLLAHAPAKCCGSSERATTRQEADKETDGKKQRKEGSKKRRNISERKKMKTEKEQKSIPRSLRA
jgi:hypothetical protein